MTIWKGSKNWERCWGCNDNLEGISSKDREAYELRTEEDVAYVNDDRLTEKVDTLPTTTVAPVREVESENPTKQILGVFRDIRTTEKVETVDVAANTPREI